MQDIVCNLCGSRSATRLLRETATLLLPPPQAVVRCDRCGLLFLHPIGQAQASQYASEEYYAQFDYDCQVVPVRRAHFAERLDRIETRYELKGRILDIGCATGEFLVLARERGWKTFGLDVSPYAIAEARRRYSLDVAAGSIEDIRLEPCSFDVVHMNHVLEHVPDPRRVLARVYQLLRDGGLLALEVPFEFYNSAETWRRLLRREVKRSTPSAYHLYFFSPRTMAALLRATGFVPQISTYSDPAERFTSHAVLKPLRWLWVAGGDRLERGSNIVAFAERQSRCAH